MKTALVVATLLSLASTLAHAETIVRIGHAGPLTGPIAHIGKDGENGARLAIEDANAKGVTIDGEKVVFELLSEDDQADPRQATTVAQRLVDEGVKGVVGHVTSGASIPASRIYSRAGIPVITPSATNPKLTDQGYEVTFRVIANDLQQGAAMAKYVQGQLKAKKVAIIDDRTAYGQGLADAFANNLKRLGVEVVAREFTSDKATDFMAILTKIKGRQPDAVFYGGMDAQAAPMLRQLRQVGFSGTFLGGDGVCTGGMIKLAEGAMSDNVYCTQAGIPMEQMPGGAEFKARFKKRFGADVQLYAPYSYDAAMTLIEAMKAANSSEPEDYLPALKKIQTEGVTGKIRFDEHGDVENAGVTLYQFGGEGWKPLN